MTTALTKQNAHEELLRRGARGPLSEEDALLWMVLFHTHRVQFKPGALAEATDGGSHPRWLSALTQRGAAGVVASCWPDRQDRRSDPAYWYAAYNSRTPYGTLGDVPPDLLPRLQQLRDDLRQDDRVAAVVEED